MWRPNWQYIISPEGRFLTVSSYRPRTVLLCNVKIFQLICTGNCGCIIWLGSCFDVFYTCLVQMSKFIRYRCALYLIRKPKWLQYVRLLAALNEGLLGCKPRPPPPPPRPIAKFKKHRFCIHSGIRGFTWFTPQPKSVTEIGCWVVHWNIEKCNKNFFNGLQTGVKLTVNYII
jgi:hypothetical protein